MHGRNRVWLGLAQTTIPAQLSIGKKKWIRQRITHTFVVTKEDLIVIGPKVNGDSSAFSLNTPTTSRASGKAALRAFGRSGDTGAKNDIVCVGKFKHLLEIAVCFIGCVKGALDVGQNIFPKKGIF